MHHHSFAYIHSEPTGKPQMNPPDTSFNIVDKSIFRNGMSRLGSAVSIVTTRHGSMRYGFTASAVCSVSDTPPTLLICINRASSSFPAFANARHFCVNTLMPNQEDLSEVFGGKTPCTDRFAFGTWTVGLTGVPVLADASVSSECEITASIDQATHRILFGRVIDIRENTQKASLIYCLRRYFYA